MQTCKVSWIQLILVIKFSVSIPSRLLHVMKSMFRCPASFQRLVELAMKGLINVIVYIDDLFTIESTIPCEIHLQYLGQSNVATFSKRRNRLVERKS